jgi:hypothetical protein
MSRRAIKTQQDMDNWLERWNGLHDSFIKALTIQSQDSFEKEDQLKTGKYDVIVEIWLGERQAELHFQNCREYAFSHEAGDDNTVFEVRAAVRHEIGIFFSFDPVSADFNGDTSEDNDWIISEGNYPLKTSTASAILYLQQGRIRRWSHSRSGSSMSSTRRTKHVWMPFSRTATGHYAAVLAVRSERASIR